MIRGVTALARIGIVVAAIVATVPMIAFAQTSEPAIESVPAEAEESVAAPNPTDDDTFAQADSSSRSAIPAEVAVEIQRHINELRREQMDDRETYFDRLLAIVAIVIAITGYLGFKKFREIVAEAKGSAKASAEYAEASSQNLKEIERNREKSHELVRDMTAQTAAAAPEEATRAVVNVQINPEASLMDKAIAHAVSLQQQDKRDDAIEKWRAIGNIAEGSDNDLAVRAWLSVGYLASGEDCILANDRAIRLKPDDADAYLNRGVAKAELGRHDAAIADYDEAIRLKPDDAAAYSNRGNAKTKLGRHDAASADHDEAIRLNPDFAAAYLNRGVAKAELGRHGAAIADHDEAIRLKPDYANAYSNRGAAKTKLGRHGAAIADHDEAIRLKPDYADAYSNRGVAKAELGEHDAAIADYDEAIRLKPDYADAYSNRGEVKAELGEHDAAIADYDEALRLKPDLAEAYYNRGAAKAELKIKDEARKDFEIMLELARNANNAKIMAQAEQALRDLDDADG